MMATIKNWFKKLKNKLNQDYRANKELNHAKVKERAQKSQEDIRQKLKNIETAFDAVVLMALNQLDQHPNYTSLKQHVLQNHEYYLKHFHQQAQNELGAEPLSRQDLEKYLDENRGEIEQALERNHRLLLQDQANIKLEQTLAKGDELTETQYQQNLQNMGVVLRQAIQHIPTSQLENMVNTNNRKFCKQLINQANELDLGISQQMPEHEWQQAQQILRQAAFRNRGFPAPQIRNMMRQGSEWSGMIQFRVWNYLGAPDRYDYNPDPQFGNVLDDSTDYLRQKRQENEETYQQKHKPDSPTPKPGNY